MNKKQKITTKKDTAECVHVWFGEDYRRSGETVEIFSTCKKCGRKLVEEFTLVGERELDS